jgi:hypothetical protein
VGETYNAVHLMSVIEASLPITTKEEVHTASWPFLQTLCAFLEIVIVFVAIHMASFLPIAVCPWKRNKKPSSSLEDEGVDAFVVPPPFIPCHARNLYRFILA